jgi:hypothetical protein
VADRKSLDVDAPRPGRLERLDPVGSEDEIEVERPAPELRVDEGVAQARPQGPTGGGLELGRPLEALGFVGLPGLHASMIGPSNNRP